MDSIAFYVDERDIDKLFKIPIHPSYKQKMPRSITY